MQQIQTVLKARLLKMFSAKTVAELFPSEHTPPNLYRDFEGYGAAADTAELLDAIANRRAVFLHRVKQTAQKSFYLLHYVRPDGSISFWWPCCYEIAKAVGMIENNRDYQQRKWLFCGQGFGVDYATHATESFSQFLEECQPGIKFQLTSLNVL